MSNKDKVEQEDMLNNIVLSCDQNIKMKKWIKNNLSYLNTQSWSYFIKAMSYLNPQSYGVYIAKRLIRELNLTETHAKKGKGDFVDHFGDHYELKVSLSIEEQPKINLVQIRPWQKTNYYFIGFVIKNGVVYSYCFKLSHEQMANEIKLTNMGSAHGTKDSLVNNENIELRKTIDINANDNTFKRWFLNYRSGFFDKFDDIISPETLEQIEFISLM